MIVRIVFNISENLKTSVLHYLLQVGNKIFKATSIRHSYIVFIVDFEQIFPHMIKMKGKNARTSAQI